ncbi:hypothetical protein [Streptomyces telluris]|uniref:Uncharacterized protein n=1 Tax=Streptomyces telluris TaxID=2720021 RepID=A0A9X2LJ76_9ACTN|nr:hypothetical protein [Streptomyces telluris]MCQ8771847.1 hypothetical protein [Streptomyces telluris]NJP82774.1 hypothetical protein [Streptomyces telluris]
MTEPIDRLLEHARIHRPPYTRTREAEERLTARIAARTWQGALRVDDALQPASVRPAAERAAVRRSLPRRIFREHLRALCETTATHDLHRLRDFLVSRVPEPDGALVLGCVLHLAGREYGARFWWQFAAGAGELSAALCLYLHHMALGETDEADLWHEQADLGNGLPCAPGQDSLRDLRAVLRYTMVQRGYVTHAPSPAVTAVIAYIPEALDDADDADVELPLPGPDFAERIEELTAGV